MTVHIPANTKRKVKINLKLWAEIVLTIFAVTEIALMLGILGALV